MNNNPWFDRFILQHEIEVFLNDFNNIFDDSIDKTVETCKNEIKKKESILKELEEDLEEIFEEIEGEIEVFAVYKPQYYEILEELYFKEEEVYVLFETKIIYAFKHFEIYAKKLLSLAYSDIDIKKLFKWQNLIEYLKLQNIDVKKLEGYEEVDQLRRANNSFKHSENFVDNDIKNIPEFVGKEHLTYSNLEAFYLRVSGSPHIFLSQLSKAVYNDLFDFDDEKIRNLAYSFARRMDNETAQKFANILLESYDQESYYDEVEFDE